LALSNAFLGNGWAQVALTAMAKKPAEPSEPEPAKPSRAPVEEPGNPYPVEKPPEPHPDEDRPLIDPVPPDKDKPRM
jgi:hypothetical protein